MYCDNRNMKQMPYIPSRMKYVYLQHNQITSVPNNAFGNATNLVWVLLHENHINSVGKQAFAKLGNLDRLYLNNNNLTEVPSNLPRSLRDLRLDHNKITKLPPNAFEGMENLTILLLHRNGLEDIGGLKGLKSLILLDVSGNQLKKVPNGLPEMLHQLYLESNSIEAVPENFLSQFTNLQYVRISHNELTNKGIPQNTFNNSGWWSWICPSTSWRAFLLLVQICNIFIYRPIRSKVQHFTYILILMYTLSRVYFFIYLSNYFSLICYSCYFSLIMTFIYKEACGLFNSTFSLKYNHSLGLE